MMPKHSLLDNLLNDVSGNSKVTIGATHTDINKNLRVSLDLITVDRQIRKVIHQSVIDRIAETYPTVGLLSMPEIREVDSAKEPHLSNFKYVIVTGEHRFRALQKLKVKDHLFKFVPTNELDSRCKIIERQFIENDTREDMHPIELGYMLIDYISMSSLDKGEVAKRFGIRNSLLSRVVKMARAFNEDDFSLLHRLGIKSEKSLLALVRLVDANIDWQGPFEAFVAQQTAGDLAQLTNPMVSAWVDEQLPKPKMVNKTDLNKVTTTVADAVESEEQDDKVQADDVADMQPSAALPPKKLDPTGQQDFVQSVQLSADDKAVVASGEDNVPDGISNQIPTKTPMAVIPAPITAINQPIDKPVGMSQEQAIWFDKGMLYVIELLASGLSIDQIKQKMKK